jgi:hypothetical protein
MAGTKTEDSVIQSGVSELAGAFSVVVEV